MIDMYRFVLVDDEGIEFMGTDVDEPNPRIDAEFWDRFMEGDCFMVFSHTYKESEED